MINCKRVNISLYENDIENLKKISKETGMTASEVLRQLIAKASTDKKTREIITWMHTNKVSGEELVRIMSNNPTKKAEPSHLSNNSGRSSSDSFSNLPNNSQIDNLKEDEIERMIRIAKAKWIDGEF